MYITVYAYTVYTYIYIYISYMQLYCMKVVVLPCAKEYGPVSYKLSRYPIMRSYAAPLFLSYFCTILKHVPHGLMHKEIE